MECVLFFIKIDSNRADCPRIRRHIVWNLLSWAFYEGLYWTTVYAYLNVSYAPSIRGIFSIRIANGKCFNGVRTLHCVKHLVLGKPRTDLHAIWIIILLFHWLMETNSWFGSYDFLSFYVCRALKPREAK